MEKKSLRDRFSKFVLTTEETKNVKGGKMAPDWTCAADGKTYSGAISCADACSTYCWQRA